MGKYILGIDQEPVLRLLFSTGLPTLFLLPTVNCGDGGGTKNDLLMQFQADILGIPVDRPVITETTVLGAAYLAGLAVGYWQSLEEIAANWQVDRRFEPQISEDQRETLYHGWKKAISRAAGWLKD